MSKLVDDVSSILSELDKARGDNKLKGSLGEKAIFRICEEVYQQQGGILYHSFTYKVDKTKEGNVKKGEDGKCYIENLGSTTEIDVLLVTPLKIIPIEVKTYNTMGNGNGGIMTLTDGGISGTYATDKTPIHQNEMHCRHLYSWIFKSIPGGASKYIAPVVVFVDSCKIKDDRTAWQKEYIPIANLDSFYSVLKELNKPCEYRLDLRAVDKSLTECCVGYEKKMPLRIL